MNVLHFPFLLRVRPSENDSIWLGNIVFLNTMFLGILAHVNTCLNPLFLHVFFSVFFFLNYLFKQNVWFTLKNWSFNRYHSFDALGFIVKFDGVITLHENKLSSNTFNWKKQKPTKTTILLMVHRCCYTYYYTVGFSIHWHFSVRHMLYRHAIIYFTCLVFFFK